MVVTAAIYGCVPETDHLRPIGAVIGGLLLAELADQRRFNWGAQLAIASVLVWAVFHGAAGHERAIAGGLFAFWPAVIVPLIALVWPGLVQRRPEPVRWAVAACGGAAALIVSRTGARDPGWGPALRSIAVWAPASLAAAAVVIALSTRRPTT